MMPVGRVYTDSKEAFFICPFCGTSKKESMRQDKVQADKISVYCTCGNTYLVQIEYRKNYRKKTNLEGMYKELTRHKNSGKVNVTDVSASGCRFSASLLHGLQLNDHIEVVFTLDNPRQTIIRKEAIVQMVDGRYVGCSFIAHPGAYDPGLGFYLRNP